MKIAYITAGAAGMFCGSCMHDNTLVSALIADGHDAILIPTYTPIRTDEADVSLKRVFFGGINVYLQQKVPLFRHTPWLLDRFLDFPGLLRWVSRFAVKTQADQLGDLTISILKGEHGYQRKEVAKLVAWLKHEARPEIVCLTNVILSGMVREIKAHLKVPVLGALQGDDIFLEALPEKHRSEAIRLIRQHCREIDGFIATSAYYADFMSGYLDIPRAKIHVVYPGLKLAGYGAPRTPRRAPPYAIGYFARICPEKGLHVLVDAFRILKAMSGTPPCCLRVSGWLGDNNRGYFDDLRRRVGEWGLADSFHHVESPDHASKTSFLQGLDVLSVPTTYREPKGMYVLEALANSVPVVQPSHGSFPELIEATGGGLLCKPDDPRDLALTLRRLLDDSEQREMLGQRGREVVHRQFDAATMSRETVGVYRRYLPSGLIGARERES